MRRGLLAAFLALSFCALCYCNLFAEEPSKSNIPQLLSNESIPQGVRKALRSVVMVAVFRPNILKNIFVVVGSGNGFIVGDHLVITCAHIAAVGEPAGTYYIDIQHTDVEIEADGRKYEANIATFSDLLLLLKVKDSADSKFEKEPLLLSPLSLNNDFTQGPWFAFNFVAPDVVFFKEFRYFSGYYVNKGINHGSGAERGILSESVVGGYSGTPILDSNGQCRGMLEGDLDGSTTLIPAVQIIDFLEKSRKGLSSEK